VRLLLRVMRALSIPLKQGSVRFIKFDIYKNHVVQSILP